MTQDQTLLDAALDQIAENGWRHFQLRQLADRLDRPRTEILAAFPTKFAIVAALLDELDAEIAAAQTDDMLDEPVRDRVFDALMICAEYLHHRKPGVIALLNGLIEDPMTSSMLLMRWHETLSKLAAGSGIVTTGPFGIVKIQGLGLLLIDLYRVWRDEEEPDLPKTMALLDRRLNEIDQVREQVDSVSGLVAGGLHKLLTEQLNFGQKMRSGYDADERRDDHG